MTAPSFNLAGRRALVTGSSQGPGRAAARLAAAPADCVHDVILTIDGGLSAVI